MIINPFQITSLSNQRSSLLYTFGKSELKNCLLEPFLTFLQVQIFQEELGIFTNDPLRLVVYIKEGEKR